MMHGVLLFMCSIESGTMRMTCRAGDSLWSVAMSGSGRVTAGK